MSLTTAIEKIWGDDTIDEVLKLVNPNHPAIFIALLWESTPMTLWIEKFKQLIIQLEKSSHNKDIVLFINSWYRDQKLEQYLETFNVKIFYIDFFATMVYDRIINHRESRIVTDWSPDFNKFLFLTGKPDKPHRIRLLYKFFKQGLLNSAEWSLFVADTHKRFLPNLLPELDNAKIDEFVETHNRNPDQIGILNHNMTHYCGIPFDYSLYKNCDFQVISETHFQNNQWITEKTWLSILNHRPFILAGDTGSLGKLKRMGFRTFENYLEIQNYDNIINSEDRLDAIVTNTKFWLSNIKNYKDAINKDIKHNYATLKKLTENNFKILQSVIDEYHLDCSINKFFPLNDPSQQSRWRQFYNGIKDPTWPECENERDFKNLPTEIQKECIEVFKYQPLYSLDK